VRIRQVVDVRVGLVRPRAVPGCGDQAVHEQTEKRGDRRGQRAELPAPAAGTGSGGKPENDDGGGVDDDAPALEGVRGVRKPRVVARELVDGVEDAVVHRRGFCP
jgi:hypothetical protein